jgi:hypothetical protein
MLTIPTLTWIDKVRSWCGFVRLDPISSAHRSLSLRSESDPAPANRDDIWPSATSWRREDVDSIPRIRHHHREAGGSQSGDERSFVSSGGFEDDERRRQGAVAVMPGISFGAVHDAPSGRHATTKSVLAIFST